MLTHHANLYRASIEMLGSVYQMEFSQAAPPCEEKTGKYGMENGLVGI